MSSRKRDSSPNITLTLTPAQNSDISPFKPVQAMSPTTEALNLFLASPWTAMNFPLASGGTSAGGKSPLSMDYYDVDHAMPNGNGLTGDILSANGTHLSSAFNTMLDINKTSANSARENAATPALAIVGANGKTQGQYPPSPPHTIASPELGLFSAGSNSGPKSAKSTKSNSSRNVQRQQQQYQMQQQQLQTSPLLQNRGQPGLAGIQEFESSPEQQFLGQPQQQQFYIPRTAPLEATSANAQFENYGYPSYSYYNQTGLLNSARLSPGTAGVLGGGMSANIYETLGDSQSAGGYGVIAHPQNLPLPEAPGMYEDFEKFDDDAVRNDPGFASYDEYNAYLSRNGEGFNGDVHGYSAEGADGDAGSKRNKRSYQCSLPVCGKIYTTTAGLRYHLRHVHNFTSIPKHTAIIAAATAALNAAHLKSHIPTNDNLQYHKGLDVSKKDPNICTIPGTNRRVKPPFYQCRECPKRFSTAAGLRYHKKTFNHTVGCGGAVGKAAAAVGKEYLTALANGTKPDVTFTFLDNQAAV